MTTRHTLSRADLLFRGSSYYPRANAIPGVQMDPLNFVNFGVIATASANAIGLSQSVGAGAQGLVNGALASAGVATIPTPRNVVAAWTGASILTITGTDYYGQPMTEVSASGTSHLGKKAFGTITGFSFSAAVTVATVGTGVQIGLPFRCDLNEVLLTRVDGAVDAATVTVADVTSPATQSTGDVRGTLSFAAAPNGAHSYVALLKVHDTTAALGPDHKTGAYGVDNV
jgi:hypothetical protein